MLSIHTYTYIHMYTYIYMHVYIGEGDVPPSAWSSPLSTGRRLALDSWALQGYAPWGVRRGHVTVMAGNTIVLMGGNGRCLHWD